MRLRLFTPCFSCQAQHGSTLTTEYDKILTIYFIETGAKNYLETRFFCEKIGFVSVTCQKDLGQSPHQLRQAAEAERDALLQIIQDYQPAGSPPPGNAEVLAKWILESLVKERDQSREACRALVNHRTMDEYIEAFNMARAVVGNTHEETTP